MPSPFPGMDPYLENHRWWRGVHNSLMTELLGYINAQLPVQFVARMEERIFLAMDDSIYPDVALIQRPRTPGSAVSPPQNSALVADEPMSIAFLDEEVYETYIEIVTARKEETVIAVIEVLSPKNKSRESNGRDVYLKKRDTVLTSGSHLVEIDLLRGETHTLAVPQELITARSRASWHYAMCLHKAGTGNKFDVWAVSVRERLPKISVPLTAGFPDVVLDMQAAITQVYARGGFDRSIDYRREPVPPLSPDDSQWADTLLRSEGLR